MLKCFYAILLCILLQYVISLPVEMLKLVTLPEAEASVGDWEPHCHKASLIGGLYRHRATVPGQAFPEGIILQDRNGNVVDFSTFRGKYVYIDMWASWCVPCLREVPVLQQLEKTLKNKNVAFVSISIDANQEAWKKKMDEKHMHGHQLWNPDGTLGKALNVKGIPFFAIYDPEGKLYMHGAPRPSQGPGLVELLEGLK